jgi:hypothetical protein
MLDFDCNMEKTLDSIHVHFTCACEYVEQLIAQITECLKRH